jgi:hypothetical protein
MGGMGHHETSERRHGEEGTTHEVRQNALRELARSQAARQPLSGDAYRQGTGYIDRSPFRRWRLTLAGILLLCLVIGGFAVYRMRSPSAPTLGAARILTLDLAATGGFCPSAMAWSPDGARLAVLVQRKNCVVSAGAVPIITIAPDVVLIYDARNGKLLASLDPFQAISATQATLAPLLSWSPDGSLLALPITVFSHTASGSMAYQPSVELLPVAGGKGRLLSSTPTTADDAPAVIWNVETGTVAQTLNLPLPVAASYRWANDGHIMPVKAQATPSATFSGSPVQQVGSQTFSFWQPGAIVRIRAHTDQGALDMDVYTASAILWSPDGRYVAPYLALGAVPLTAEDAEKLYGVAPHVCSTVGVAPCAATQPDYPDRAFQHIAQQGVPATIQGNNSIPLAWRPDGKVLATVLPCTGCQSGFDAANGRVRLSLLDTSTGATSKTLDAATPHSTDIAWPLYADLLWSPTGHQLAFEDTMSSQITIWGAGELPK